jgi:ATP-dependent Clp protease ATP-binding subunit ClpC
MAHCELCTRVLLQVGRFWICQEHGDRTVGAGKAAAATPLHVPIYGTDFRALIHADFSELAPIPDESPLVGTVADRLTAYRKRKETPADSPAPLIGFLPGTTLGTLKRLSDGTSVKAVPAEYYYPRFLAHVSCVTVALLELGPSGLVPETAQFAADEAVAAEFWARYEGLLLPPMVLDGLLYATRNSDAHALLVCLEGSRKQILDRDVSLDQAQARHIERRVTALTLGANGELSDRETAFAEFFCDLLLLQRFSMQDLLRAEKERDPVEPRSVLIKQWEEEANLAVEACLPLLLRSSAVSDAIPASLRPAVRIFGQARRPYFRSGVLNPEDPDADLTAPAAKAETGMATQPTTMLDQLGKDLTRLAEEGKLPAVIGRHEELQLIMETLCRSTKRNPLLVGPAGTGKTAIVEGLAQKIAAGEVPDVLKGKRIIELHVSTLIAGTTLVGQLEEKIEPLLKEAAQGGIILFIDEVHTMVGAGSSTGNDNDIAQMFKPAMARGEVCVIGATTDGEYRHFIEKDAALERRFQPVRVQEPSPEDSLQILKTVRDRLSETREIAVSDDLLRRIVTFARQFLPNRHFPDKAVDLLEQCVSHAVLHGKKAVEPADAESVVRRMVGMPLGIVDRLTALAARLDERALLGRTDAEALISRLGVAMRGMDLESDRPNAVALLVGEAEDNAEALAESLAESLYGAKDRVVSIDFSRFTHPTDLSLLIGGQDGSRPSGMLPLQRVTQTPWCVLLLHNVHACHWQILEFLRQAIADGRVTDSNGKRLYLSDTIVLMTAKLGPNPQGGGAGFHSAAEDGADARVRQTAETVLGPDFIREVDLVCYALPAQGDAHRRWLEEDLLVSLRDRYREHEVVLHWDGAFVDWLLRQHNGLAHRRRWQQILDEQLSPLLVPHLPEMSGQRVELHVGVGGENELRVMASSVKAEG